MRFRLLFVLLSPLSLAAQATVTVSMSDPVYRDLDRLFGSGLVKTMFVVSGRIRGARSRASCLPRRSPRSATPRAKARGV